LFFEGVLLGSCGIFLLGFLLNPGVLGEVCLSSGDGLKLLAVSALSFSFERRVWKKVKRVLEKFEEKWAKRRNIAVEGEKHCI
jgi:hypothetical protein